MGHLVNPVSLRLYNIRYWDNNWYVFNSFNKSSQCIVDILVYNFIKKFIVKTLKCDRIGIMFCNLKVLRSYNRVNLYIYVHDCIVDLMLSGLGSDRYSRVDGQLNLYGISKSFFGKFSNFVTTHSSVGGDDAFVKAISKYSKAGSVFVVKALIIEYLKYRILNTFWYFLKCFVVLTLNKLFNNSAKITYELFVLGLNKYNINASVLSEYFFRRLSQFYTLGETLRSANFILKLLMFRFKIVNGYKVMCSGRFTRKQRATYSWKVFGKLGFGTMKSKLDYSYTTIALKYGSCTIKVWVNLRKAPTGLLVDYII